MEKQNIWEHFVILSRSLSASGCKINILKVLEGSVLAFSTNLETKVEDGIFKTRDCSVRLVQIGVQSKC